MWDNSVFDRAFDRAGIRQRVIRLISGSPAGEFMARFDRPQQIIMDGVAHTTDYVIEFTTTDVPGGLEYHDLVDIEVSKGVLERFRVNQEPLQQGDGYWTRATLERMP